MCSAPARSTSMPSGSPVVLLLTQTLSVARRRRSLDSIGPRPGWVLRRRDLYARELGLERDFVTSRFGPTITFGPLAIGRNIDNLCCMGFARIDELAAISAPDIFDDEI